MQKQITRQVTQAMQEFYPKNLPPVPAKAALTDLEISDRTKALNALHGKLICESSTREINQVLGKIFILTGLKEKYIPCADEESLIVNFIQVNYPNKSLEEFILAFNLAITGKLDLQINDVKLFDIFSCEYLGRIMAAYARWLKEVYNRQQEILKSASLSQLPATNVKLTEKQWNEFLSDSLKLPFDNIPVMLYDHYDERKKIILTVAEKKQYLQDASDYLDRFLRKTNIQQHTLFEKMKEDGFYGPMKTLLINTSKRLIIWKVLMKRDISLLLCEPIKQLNQKTKKPANEKPAKSKSKRN